MANSGTISAKLGHVVLAGAKTATLDLFGDGLLSLDVTNQVTQAPIGPDGKAAAALVTNTGVIIADGGTVQLTARAADGIVQNLVQAGGTIRAATMGDQAGVVALNGVGGSVVVEGQLSAPGLTPGTKGGAIEVTSSHDVVVAASARIDASGAAGGGVAAIGTTLARAKGGPGVTPTTVARNVTVQRGATIAADATTGGNGGNVTLLSTDATRMDGLITVRGGAQGGDGGLAEVSGGVVSYTGQVDATAPLGAIGTLLLDPLDLFVSDVQPVNTIAISSPTVAAGGSPDAITSSWISPAFLAGQSANISLATSRDLFVNSPVTLTGAGQSLTLQAGRNLDVEANLTAPGNIVLNSHTDLTTFAAGALTVNAVVQASGSVFLGGHNLAATVNPATGLFDFLTGITIGASGSVRSVGTNPLVSIACDCAIAASPGSFRAIGGTVEIGPLRPGDSRDLGPLGSFANSSIFVFGLAHNPLTNAPLKDQNITIDPTAPIGAATLDLEAIGSATQPAGSPLTNLAGLIGSVGSANLTGGLNTIGSLGPFTTSTGDFSLTAAGPLTIAGALNVAGKASVQTTADLIVGSSVNAHTELALTSGSALTIGGPVTANNDITLTAGTGGMRIVSDVVAPAISLTSGLGGIALTGNAKIGQTGGRIDITSTGPVSETSTNTITANAMTSSGGVNGNVSLLGTGNAIDVFLDFSVTNGDLVLVNGADLTLFGPLKANNLFFEVAKAGGTLTFGFPTDALPPSPTAVPATLSATATGGRISLVADNYAVVPTGAPPSSSITTTAGPVELAPFSATGTSVLGTGGLVPLVQTNGGTLEVGGFTNVPAGANSPAARASSVDIAGALDLGATAATLRLNSKGSITQTGGPLTVANLTGSAGTSAILTQPANQIDTLGAFSTGAGFALVNNKSLRVAGPVTDTGGASTLALTTRAGDITLAGNVSAANTVNLISAGAINQTGGSLVAGTLTGSAATFAGVTQPNNLVGTLGSFSTGAGFALVNNQSLLVAGPVQDTGGASTLALTTRTGDITLEGSVSATNVVNLVSAGAIDQIGGFLAARTLTGSAGSSAGATLTSDNAISFLGPFTATSGVIDLTDSIPLTINGALTARLIFITATGSISLASDITTGGLANLTTVPTDPLASLGGAFFSVLPNASGNSSFAANSNVASLDGTGTVMFVSMPAQGGNVGLTNLNAPSTELLLNLGSGNASGQVNVGSLFVLGAGGQVNFTNSIVQGFTGSAAALAAQSSPPANPAYLLNGCEIGVGCIIVPPPPPPPPCCHLRQTWGSWPKACPSPAASRTLFRRWSKTPAPRWFKVLRRPIRAASPS